MLSGGLSPTPAQLARLNARVDRSGGPGACWPYLGRKKIGYGQVGSYKTARIPLHRWALEQKLGRALKPGEVTRHRCDNPPCVNPAHLLPGSPADNGADRVARGRATAGERLHFAKLSAVQVREILALRGTLSIPQIAANYGVYRTAVWKIFRGEIWNRVTGLPRTRRRYPKRSQP